MTKDCYFFRGEIVLDRVFAYLYAYEHTITILMNSNMFEDGTKC